METRFVAAPDVPVSWGELIDKITILEIKSERIFSEDSLAHVRKELAALQKIAEPVIVEEEIARLKALLRQTNERLWEIENRIREEDAAGDFGAAFIALARSVYQNNDERAAIKKKINLLLACELIEEKSYRSNATP